MAALKRFVTSAVLGALMLAAHSVAPVSATSVVAHAAEECDPPSGVYPVMSGDKVIGALIIYPDCSYEFVPKLRPST
jgi:hypothetical protein